MNATDEFPAPVARSLAQRTPFLWINDGWQALQDTRAASTLNITDVRDAENRLIQFSGLLKFLFPELAASDGIIESPLYPAHTLQNAIMGEHSAAGRWLIKGDHALPVVGSIKARGGIYAVLLHAEKLALTHGLLKPHQDRLVLASSQGRALFAGHRIAVGSTGNLGLSIGVAASALGFQTTVHMSSDAKEWKKARLKALGVEIIEHAGDFGIAVAAGRAQATQSPKTFFVDDENSEDLFLGYSVAAMRLAQQLIARKVRVDAQYPLFVYLPCGVGGAPGGITFGLRHLLGDHVHCFFAEPVASPCMLVRLANRERRPMSVLEIALDNSTEADGLAVSQASEFVAPLMHSLVSGVFTVADEDLLEDLYVLEQTEGLRIEPSAAAALRGPRWIVESATGRDYLLSRGIYENISAATHILWTTGGALVPDTEYYQFHQRGRMARTARRDRVPGTRAQD